MRRAKIEEENRRMLDRQRQFRRTADILTDAWAKFPEVEVVAVIGSVAGPLWKEVPRFSEFRRERVEIWHECADLDLALWVTSQDNLGALRRALVLALGEAFKAGIVSTASHEVDTFLFEPGSDRYLGRLCHFNQCPKGRPDCLAPGCGTIRFNKVIEDFVPHSGLLAPTPHATLYRRGMGRLRSALDLPATV